MSLIAKILIALVALEHVYFLVLEMFLWDRPAGLRSGAFALSGEHIMEVILREHIDNLGRRGEVVKVAAGYARNFLLPRKLALVVTEANKQQIERERKVAEVRDAQEHSAAEAYSQRLEQLEIEIARRVGENDVMYGSVTSADIAHALEAKGFELDKRKIQLVDPIKALGQVEVPVKVHRDVTARVRVKVVAQAS